MSAAASLLILAVAWFAFGDNLVHGITDKLANRKTNKELLAANKETTASPSTKSIAKDEVSDDGLEVLGDAIVDEMEDSYDDASDIESVTRNVPPAVRRSPRRLKKVKPVSNGIVSGMVVDEAGQPLIGANIYFPVNEAAITTDFDGKFAVQLKDYDSTAIVNYRGLNSDIFPLTNSQTHQFRLNIDAAVIVANEINELSTPEISANSVDGVFDEKKQALAESASDGLDQALTVSSIEASPEKGFRKYEKYIKRSLNYPSAARLEKKEGQVIVQFKVLPNGELFDVRVLQGLGYGCDEEAIRLIKEGPSWAAEDQKSVRQATYSIQFEL